MAEIVSIRECVRRSKEEDTPISEYALRLWVKQGAVPYRKVGSKVLLHYPTIIRYACGEIPTVDA